MEYREMPIQTQTKKMLLLEKIKEEHLFQKLFDDFKAETLPLTQRGDIKCVLEDLADWLVSNEWKLK